MSPQEIITAAEQAGLRLQVDGSKLTVLGAGAHPASLLQEIRAQRDQLIAWLCERSEKSEESQISALPPADLPLPEVMVDLAPEEQDRIINLVMQQGKPAIGWCVRRASQYYDKFPGSGFKEQDAASAWDLLEWQRLVKERG